MGSVRAAAAAAALLVVAAFSVDARVDAAAGASAAGAPVVAAAATPHLGSDRGPAGHEGAEGLQLAPEAHESVEVGKPCDGEAPARRYDVVALAVDMTVNRYGDHDPRGRMFALEDDVARVRDEEARNTAAREDPGAEPGVSIGLTGDAIQPLVIRVNAGECLVMRLRNDLDEPASLHLHGSSLRIRGGGAAIASNAEAMAARGAEAAYEWRVPDGEPEGTHYFHSHGDSREQTSHGLFGAVIVEPRESAHLDPRTGEPLESGWDAVIAQPGEVPFREFALLYHEIGDETYQLRDRSGAFVPLVDPILGAYRPGSRGVNYRSEPFMNRMALQQSLVGRFDESLAYSSYAFGDPATPVMRTYLGERTKQRVVHAGSEVFQVHHVHGGSVRWRRQPGLGKPDPTGLVKRPPLLPGPSERTDAQSIGPAESFDVENECGAGGASKGPGTISSTATSPITTSRACGDSGACTTPRRTVPRRPTTCRRSRRSTPVRAITSKRPSRRRPSSEEPWPASPRRSPSTRRRSARGSSASCRRPAWRADTTPRYSTGSVRVICTSVSPRQRPRGRGIAPVHLTSVRLCCSIR